MISHAVAIALMLSIPAPSNVDIAVDGVVAKGFAGEILVTDQTRTIYGRAVSAPGRPHRRGDLWRWASVTKQVTATLTMQAVAAGKLSLDDTLAKRLPAFHGPTASTITVRMLLQHTSGLPNPDDTPTTSKVDFPDFYRRSGRGVGGPRDALGYCAGSPKAQPGAGSSYNNCDYIVLGALLEQTNGKRFPLLVQDAIARPAGLTTLRIASDGVEARHLVHGLLEGGVQEQPFNLATFGPAGAAFGSADDLARFDRALLARALLDDASTETAWAGDPKLGYVALGAWGFAATLKGCVGRVKLVERRGEIGGVEVRNLLAPEKHLALIVFADRSDLDFGEIWQSKGLTYDLASAAFCG